ncbi:MAG: phospholipid carrier-dependent glycosyltransferase, partial [Candidatus Pacebacteria bacterium]|nr:phospholipid carrier-dependent glycosyltransferase [Candidatus Paceibacterota bacterium]
MFENFLAKKYVVPAILLLIMFGAFAVRFYHYDTWLYFKMDQSRDAFTISNAVKNGPGNLPLLGARAGATKVTYGFLHLGPVFYYFQYLSGVIFHSTSPQVFAYPDLFFSIAVLPLLYIFLRLYFSRLNSLLIVAMYAFSFLVIEYSRFAWNPNSLPFFTILSFYGLLKFLHEPEEKKRKWWLILWAIGLTVGSQLHFMGFFSLVGISALLFFFHYELWKKENIRGVFQENNFRVLALYAGLAFLVVLIFYAPVIISDSMKNWANTKDFFQAFSTKQGNRPITTRAIIGLQSQIEYYVMIFTSYIITKGSNNTYGSLLSILIGALFVGGSYLIYKFFKETKDNLRKDFLLLVFLWFFIFLLITIPVATQIEPRYFIFTFAVPFIFLGF